MDAQTLRQQFDSLCFHYLQGETRPLEWRVRQLLALKRLLNDHYADLSKALEEDLNKSAFEAYATEMGFVILEIDHTLKHLKQWMRSPVKPTPTALQAATSRVLYEPLGVVLISGAWNYPIQLTLGPLVCAIAAGNAAMIKPPRTAAATFKMVAGLFPQYMDQNVLAVVNDDTPNEMLLDLPWDKIMLTGSGQIGKIVMAAAAKHLTPVTLELGGKSPTFVDETANLKVAARRIVQGKFMNAGQTCVAPDYILVKENTLDALIKAMIEVILAFFGSDPSQSADYGRIINLKQFDKLQGFLKDGEIVYGGQSNREQRYMAPTLLKHVSPDSAIMQQEIFGPILPILPVKTMDEAIDFVNKRDKPLALYIFSENRATIDTILNRTTSGGVCINDTIFHLANHDLPFGGVGPSGMGKYHGEYGFREFSNARAIYDHDNRFDSDIRYPPFTPKKLAMLKRMMTLEVPFALQGILSGILKIFGGLF